jgi:hypothetical protein
MWGLGKVTREGGWLLLTLEQGSGEGEGVCGERGGEEYDVWVPL